MKLIKYIGITLMVSTLASCSSDDSVMTTWESDPEAVRLQAMVGSGLLSRSNPMDSDESQFNNGDQLNVQADGQGPYTYTLTNGTWMPTGNEYLIWKKESLNLKAYTLLRGATENSFSLPTDQNNLTNIAAADYMTFTGTCTKPIKSSEITMQLQRQTSRIDITVDKMASNISDFTINGNTVISNGQGSKIGAFTPYKWNKNLTYSVLVAPNATQQADKTFITLKVNGTPLSVTGIPVAQKGKKYSYKLSISQHAVVLNSVSVSDWTAGDTFNGGEIGSNPVKVDAASHTIITKQEGKLTPDLIKQATSSDGQLIITGPLNSKDIETLGQQTAQQTKPAITSLDLGQAKVITVPANAFQNSKNLTSLTLPATVIFIGDGFISGCNKLTSLTIMSSMNTLVEIKATAFTGFTNAGNCDLKLDSSRNDQIDEDATKVFANLTWKSITDLNGSEFTGSEGGIIGGEGSDYPVE